MAFIVGLLFAAGIPRRRLTSSVNRSYRMSGLSLRQRRLCAKSDRPFSGEME
jgi:hypothetical protein